MNTDSIKATLRACKSESDGRAFVESLGLSASGVQQLGKSLCIYMGAHTRKADGIKWIVRCTTGAVLDTAAIHRI